MYGGDVVIVVDVYFNEMVNGLNELGKFFVKVVYKGIVNFFKEVEVVFKVVNNDEKCIGVIIWMYIFFLVKMWIYGL